jgi:hypothetical protein
VQRAARLGIGAVSLLVLGAALYLLVDALRDWSASDIDAYWSAAMRLRSGEPLYAFSYSVGAHDIYRYAPWFAFAWVPLTYLPRAAVTVGWTAILLAATGAAIWPTLRQRSWSTTLVSILLGSMLVWTSAKGNVHALMVAELVHGVRHRSGPLAVALAASLKAAPIALVAVYLGRREWARAAWTVALTVALTGPMLLFDLSGYERNPGLNASVYYVLGPGLWLVAAAAAFATAIVLARTRWRWVTGAVAAIAAFPRLLSYDASLLLIATGHRDARDPTP